MSLLILNIELYTTNHSGRSTKIDVKRHTVTTTAPAVTTYFDSVLYPTKDRNSSSSS